MSRSIAIVLGGFWTIVLVALGLWAWQRAESIVSLAGWNRPAVGIWAVRCASLTLISGAQAILLSMVVERIFRPDRVCAAARLSALVVGMAGFVSAIALGFAGR